VEMRKPFKVVTVYLGNLGVDCTECSTDEETGLATQIGCDASPRLPSPSPLARVNSLADSLTSASVHAHIYKNTVKR
jgi:hypothetical protein